MESLGHPRALTYPDWPICAFITALAPGLVMQDFCRREGVYRRGSAGYIAFLLTSLTDIPAFHHYNGLLEFISLQGEWVVLAEYWE